MGRRVFRVLAALIVFASPALAVDPPPALDSVPVPEPSNLGQFVKDKNAAIRLGKALFWDMQVGSDGRTACASCHYQAGADVRVTNTLNRGPLSSGFEIGGPNHTLTLADFPFRKTADPTDRNSTLVRDSDDVTGSQGVTHANFVDIVPGQAREIVNHVFDPDGFSAASLNVRKVTGRNAPTAINAIFNLRSFHDGRANFFFNGVNPFGPNDPNAQVLQVQPGGAVQRVAVQLDNASLASQAVGPVLNHVEMSAAGRSFPKVGKKMLSLTPLGGQRVDPTDSRLGALSRAPLPGLTGTYRGMIQAAFQDAWWNSNRIVDASGNVVASPAGSTDEFTVMEANFSLFWGLAIQLYEATLVSDDAPYDRFRNGDSNALTQQQKKGLDEFLNGGGKCIFCHSGPEFTIATFNGIVRGEGAAGALGAGPVERMAMEGGTAIYDNGFYNIGVRPTVEDLGSGGTDPFGNPLSLVRMAQLHGEGVLPVPSQLNPGVQPAERVVERGAFKTPTLRNVELTGPYFHNGGKATLLEVVQFYARGADFKETNLPDRDPEIGRIAAIVGNATKEAELVAFLESLTDERVRFRRAPFDHPQLFLPHGHDWVEDAPGSGVARDVMIELPAVGAAGGAPLVAFLGNSTPPSPQPPGAPLDLTATVLPAANAILDLPFNASSGQTAADASDNANHARLGSTTGADANDPAWIAGSAGGALQFDGANDYLEVADAASLDLLGSFTFEAWVRRDASRGGCIVSKGDGQHTIRIVAGTTGTVTFRWETTGGSKRETSASSAITAGSWHHLACVYDQSAGKLRIFVNGVLKKSSSASGVPVANALPLYIGARRSGSSLKEYFGGALDGVRLAHGAAYTTNFVPAAMTVPIVAATALPGDEVAASRVALAWRAPASIPAAATYNVWRAVNGAAATLLASNSTAITYTDPAAPAGSICYHVTAVGSNGLESAASNSACITVEGAVEPPPPAPPGAPQNFIANFVQVPAGATGAAAWVFDEGNGQSAADASGHGHALTAGVTSAVESSDPSWTAGIAGGAFLFDGVNDHARTPDAAGLRFTGSFTLEAWVKRGTGGTADCIVSKGDSDRRNYWMMLDSSGRVNFRWETSGGANHELVSSSVITDAAWHHVACVYDQAAGRDRIFLDGVLIKEGADSGTPTTSQDPVIVGARLSSGSLKDFFAGAIDLVRVTPSALYTSNFVPPVSFATGGAQTVAQLGWQAPPGSGVSGYNVFRQLNGGSFAKLNAASIATTSYVDPAPPVGALCYRVTAVGATALEGAASNVACVSNAALSKSVAANAPERLALGASPNPFNPTTTLHLALPFGGRVWLAIYDARGARVRTLLATRLPAGRHAIVWDGRDVRGSAVASGIYFSRLDVEGVVVEKRLVLLK